MILAVVFPAMVVATLALAYYGYKYTDDVSRRMETLFRYNARASARRVFQSVETRLNNEALELFTRISTEMANPAASELPEPCHVEAPPVVTSFVVMYETSGKDQCVGPPRAKGTAPRKGQSDGEKATERQWQQHRKPLNWSSVTENFRYDHRGVDDESVLIAYKSERTPQGRPYYVAARIDTKACSRLVARRVGKNRGPISDRGCERSGQRGRWWPRREPRRLISVRSFVRQGALRLARSHRASQHRRAVEKRRNPALFGASFDRSVDAHLGGWPWHRPPRGHDRTPRLAPEE